MFQTYLPIICCFKSCSVRKLLVHLLRHLYSSTNLDNLLSLPEITVTQSMQYFDKSFIKLLPLYSLNRFDSDIISCLRTCYLTFLPHINPLDIPQLCRKYKCISGGLRDCTVTSCIKEIDNPHVFRLFGSGIMVILI